MDGVVGIAARGFVFGGRVQALQKLPHVVVPPLSLAAMLPVTLLFRVETGVPVQSSVCPSALRMACNSRGPAPDLSENVIRIKSGRAAPENIVIFLQKQMLPF